MKAQYADPGLALRKTIQTPAGTSYETFQANRHSPQQQAQKAQLEQSLGVDRLSDAQYQQRVFDRGMGALKQQAQATPTQSVFTPDIRQAAYQANRDRDLSTGNRVQPTTKTAVDAFSLQDRSQQLSQTSQATAPGMPLTNPSMPTIKRKPPVPLSPAVAKYSTGTDAIKAKATDKLTSQPTSVVPLNQSRSLDEASSQVLADMPPAQIPTMKAPGGLAKGGTEAVAAYQRKLNSQGANLTVDGAWGAKTQAAFFQLQGKSTPTRKASAQADLQGGDLAASQTSSPPSASMVGKGTGVQDYARMDFLKTPPAAKPAPTPLTPPQPQPTASDPTPWTSQTQDQVEKLGMKTTDDWYDGYGSKEGTSPSGQKYKVAAGGYQIYPNGRVKTPGGTMRQGPALPRRKTAPGK